MWSSEGRAVWLSVLIVAAVAIGFRAVPIGDEALEGDELFTRSVATAPFDDALADVLVDAVHPPLYYLGVRGVLTVFGDGPLRVRGLSLLAGMVLVGLVGWIGWRATRSALVGCGAALLVALSADQIFYAQQARSYSLFALLVLALAWSVVRAVEGRRRGWVVVGLFAAAAVMVHYLAVLYLVATGLALATHAERRRFVSRFALACAPGALLLGGWLAWVDATPRQVLEAEVLGWLGLPERWQLLRLFGDFAGFLSVPQGVRISVALLVAVAAAGILVLRRTRAGRATPRVSGEAPESPFTIVLWTCLLFVPPVLLFVVTLPPLSRPVWHPRYLLPSQAFAALVLTAGPWWIFRGRSVWVATATALFAGTALVSTLRYPLPRRVPFHTAAAFIAEQVGGETVIAVDEYSIARPLRYYLGPEPRVGVWAITDVGILRWRRAPLRVAYRPIVPAEVDIVRAIEEHGWIRDPAAERRFGRTWGVTIARFTAPVAASQP